MITANPHPASPAVRQSRRWPFIIVGLLAGHFLLMMTAVFVITHNNHDSLVRDDNAQGVYSNTTQPRTAPAARLP